MPSQRVKTNFSAGELDPLLHGRTDLDQWSNGARTMRNVRPLPQGGFKRRDGTRLAQELVPVLTQLTAGITATYPSGGAGAPADDPTVPTYRDRNPPPRGGGYLP